MNNITQNVDNIDINASDFYNKVQDEIESDTARLKKSIAIVRNLRLVAAEIEVETAALYHAELFQKIEELKHFSDKFNKETIGDNIPSQKSVLSNK